MSVDHFTRQALARQTRHEPTGERAASGESGLRRRMRELKANLVRDIMDAISMATADELGELVPAPRERRAAATDLSTDSPKRRERERRTSKARSSRIWVASSDEAANEPDVSSPPAANDPFDITSPMELLASTDEQSSRPRAVQERPARTPAILEPPRPAESVTSLVNGDNEAASERRPTVVLREGERLLSAAASGIVIRRERRVAPPR